MECDPSIKAIINRINDEHNHDFIIEDIDDEHVLIKSTKLDELKLLLKEVRTAWVAQCTLLISRWEYRSSKTPSKKQRIAQTPNEVVPAYPFSFDGQARDSAVIVGTFIMGTLSTLMDIEGSYFCSYTE